MQEQLEQQALQQALVPQQRLWLAPQMAPMRQAAIDQGHRALHRKLAALLKSRPRFH